MALISNSHFLPLNTALYLMNQDMLLRCIDKIPACGVYLLIIKIKFPQCSERNDKFTVSLQLYCLANQAKVHLIIEP